MSGYDRPMSDTKLGWVAPTALVIAVVAVALAALGLVRSSSSGDAPKASGEEAKTAVCGAFAIVRTAVSLQTNADLGKDRAATQAVAANARLATLGGGQFMLARLDTNEVPTELADAVRSFANNLEYIGMGQLAGVPAQDPNQTTRLNDAQADAERVVELCE